MANRNGNWKVRGEEREAVSFYISRVQYKPNVIKPNWQGNCVVNGRLLLFTTLSYIAPIWTEFTFIFHDDFVTLYFLVLCSSINGLHHFLYKAIVTRSVFANVNINLITLPWKENTCILTFWKAFSFFSNYVTTSWAENYAPCHMLTARVFFCVCLEILFHPTYHLSAAASHPVMLF